MNRGRSASIDIGSNTFRLLIADPPGRSGSAPWKTVFYTHRIVRLGEGLHHSGRLGEHGMGRALNALKEFSHFLTEHNVAGERIHAVATAAMREAENGEEFRRQVLTETGIDIRIIAGDQEAALSLEGSCSVLTPEIRCDMLLFDIGGGSTEFVRAHDGNVIDAISRKLGVVRLVESHLRTDPPSPQEFAAMKAEVEEHLDSVERFWKDDRPPGNLVGTAGTVTTLAAIEMDLFPYRADAVNNHRISLDAFTVLRDRLLAMTHAEREQLRTIEAGRADLIVAGIAIIETMMERWNYAAFVTVDAGLLEGVWLNPDRLANQSK